MLAHGVQLGSVPIHSFATDLLTTLCDRLLKLDTPTPPMLLFDVPGPWPVMFFPQPENPPRVWSGARASQHSARGSLTAAYSSAVQQLFSVLGWPQPTQSQSS